MEDDATLLHDHSTVGGRLSLFLHRLNWKVLIGPVVFLAAFAGTAILIVALTSKENGGLQRLSAPPSPPESLSGEEKIPDWTVVKFPREGEVEAEGCENGLYTFEGFDSTVPSATAKSLRIRNLVINAPQLTESLQEWKSLESIVMENIWVNGNFSRVYLPSLQKFIFHQFRNGKTDQYKQNDVLKQTLFFDKGPDGGWDLNELVNLNMSVQVSIEGTKIIEIEPDTGEINLNTHTCEELFKTFKKPFPLQTLTLNWCPVGNATLEKLNENREDLKFLFLNNAVPSSTEGLARIVDSLRNLKELHLFQRFHCDWPGYQIYLNISNLSPSLETLSVTNLDLAFEFGGGNSIRNLSLDQYVGDEVVENFPVVFPNLKTLGLFNITQNRSYAIIEKVLRMGNKPELVIVTDLKRLNEGKSFGRGLEGKQNKNNGNSLLVLKVEEVLKAAGVPKEAQAFKLELKGNGTYVGRELTSFERNFERFTRLAFRKIDTYADYVTWDADPK